MDTDLILKITDLSKSFGPIRALRNVRFELRKGEIHAIAGENGAGKSTLMNVIDGILRPDSGEILFSDVLDADRVSLESQMSLAAGARDLAISWVRLQVATGRGSQVGLTVAPTGPMPLAAN